MRQPVLVQLLVAGFETATPPPAISAWTPLGEWAVAGGATNGGTAKVPAAVGGCPLILSSSRSHRISSTSSFNMGNPEEWVEILKQCKYLPEQDLKELCEMVTPSFLALWRE